jgi:antitoxin component of MazEF toxin-antitoxin module
MAATNPTGPTARTYRVEVGEQETMTLPATLSDQLGIATGDVVEVRVTGDQATIHRVTEESMETARRVMRERFKSQEDIDRFIEEERRAWDERDELLEADRKLLWERFRSSRE